jgi:nucleotide-binding universal stress UspA family protein
MAEHQFKLVTRQIGKTMPNAIELPVHIVLLATDLSDNSPVALNYAVGIASAYRAKLFLVHVLDPATTSTALDSSPSDLRNLALAAKLELTRISQSLLAAQGITCEIIVRHGNVRDLIFQAQQECSADLVVLGSSGRKGKPLGSVSEAVLRSIPCSVLTVGPHVERRQFSPKAQSILFPTDFSAPSLAALPAAASLAVNLSARLVLLHICDPYHLHSCFEHEAECGKKLSDLARSVKKKLVHVETFIQQGSIAESTVSFAKEKNVDYIVMGVHHGDLEDGTRLQGTVSDIVREALCPVLTVAEDARARIQ